jgi:NAD(P)-dependent dehydrogenase (short-subunit alcohol dehydrogenase family)
MRAGDPRTTSRSIVLISSIGSAFNRAHARFIPVYSPTKAALDQLTRALALTAAEDGIRIYTCNPGVTDTDMGRGVSQSQFPHETLEEFARHYNPNGHAASAGDVGAAVWRLLKGTARVQASLSADPGDAVAAQPGDALACFAGGALLNMAALYASMAGDDADAVAPWRTKAST